MKRQNPKPAAPTPKEPEQLTLFHFSSREQLAMKATRRAKSERNVQS